MSKCLEFGPDQNFKPRKPQAEEISGSQLWSVHPWGNVEQPQEVGKHEKPPRNSFQPSFSHFSRFLPLSSSVPHFLHPTTSPRTNQSLLLLGGTEDEQERSWSTGGAMGSVQMDVPAGELGRLEPKGPWAWLRVRLQKGATRAGLLPSQTRLLGLGCLPEREKV